MGKSKKDLGYFQFPLCLLSMPLSEKELVQVIVSWVLVNKGSVLLDKLLGSAGNPDLEEIRKAEGRNRLDEIIDGMISTGRLRLDYGFNREDWRHLSVAMMMRAHPNLTSGGFSNITRRYERTEAYRKQFEAATGGPDAEVRLRQDIVWNLNGGQLSLREFRVLAGLYTAIGQKPYARVSLNRLRYLAAGYRSEEVYHKAAAMRGTDDSQTPKLPNPPFRSVQQSAKRKGFFRYYEAYSWWQEVAPNVPFTGEGGVFRTVLTNRGPLFQIQPEHADPSGKYVQGRIAPVDVFRPGDEVYFYPKAGQAKKGSVTRTAYQSVYVSAEGQEYNTSGLSGFVTPAALVDEALREWREQHREASTPAKAPRTLYTSHQLRKTRDDLVRIGYLHAYHDGRHVWYSHRKTSEQIAEARVKRTAYKAAAEAKRLNLQAEALERQNEHLEAVEAARARLAAARAKTPKAKRRPATRPAAGLSLFDLDGNSGDGEG